MSMIIAFFLGVIGFVMAKIFSGKTEGERGIIPSLIIKKEITDYKIIINFHHWLLSLSLILVLAILYRNTLDLTLYLIISFLLGFMVQGLTYKDRLDILKIIKLPEG